MDWHKTRARTTITKAQRRAALERARYRCQRCGSTERLEVHHADQNPHNQDPANHVVLCEQCHDQVPHEQRRGAAL
jgi:5-methylcytosine-specific restriction endonuclease McrA